MRRALAATLVLFSLALASRPAFAHGFGQSYDLPLPLWLYLYGAGAAVLVSFVPISLFAGGGRPGGGGEGYPRFDLLRIGPLRAALTGRALIRWLRLLSIVLFLLVILSGLFGEQSESYNFAPTFVWILWWVGLSFFTAFVGNLWPLVNPWAMLFEWADGLARRMGGRLELHEPYPEGWGVWPAVALYAAFIWVELVFYGSSVPISIAFLTLSYSVVT